MKAKQIFAAIAALAAVISLTACFGNYSGSQLNTESKSGSTAAEITARPGATTAKPFVEAQTEVLNTTEAQSTAEKATDILIKTSKSWPNHALLKGLPKAKADKIQQVSLYKNSLGNRLVVLLDDFSYDEYLAYIERVENAGFSDRNSRANIPASAPGDVAMFYSSFDSERSLGIYWYGADSSAGCDCIIVIGDFDMAKG